LNGDIILIIIFLNFKHNLHSLCWN
jgi:hypothetical protein